MLLFPEWIGVTSVRAGVLLFLGIAVRAEKPPTPTFAQKEVSFRSGGNGLHGVLVLPKTRGPHPAVVFVHGSGSLDRNDWRSHPVLREHLPRHGIASLCWDKPGVGTSSGHWTEQSFHDRAREALDAVKFLQGRPEIDRKHIGLWGISQGGWICPLAGSLSADVGFLILVSAPAGTIEEHDFYRIEQEMRADNLPGRDIDRALSFARRRIELIRSGPYEKFDEAQREVSQEKWFKDYVHWLRPADFAFGKKNIAYDGRPVLKCVKCPVLILVGGRDTIVPAKKSAVAIEDILKKAGNKDVTVRTFQGRPLHARANNSNPRREAHEDPEERIRPRVSAHDYQMGNSASAPGALRGVAAA